MDSADENAVLVKDEELHKLVGHLKSILLQKCEEKRDAFLKGKRSANGQGGTNDTELLGLGRFLELIATNETSKDNFTCVDFNFWQDYVSGARSIEEKKK